MTREELKKLLEEYEKCVYTTATSVKSQLVIRSKDRIVQIKKILEKEIFDD